MKKKTPTKPRQKVQDTSDVNTNAQESLADMNTALLEGFGDISAQMAKFFAQRIEEDVNAQHQLLQCKNLADVQHVQLRFFEQAFKQYQESTARMMDIGTHILTQSSSSKG